VPHGAGNSTVRIQAAYTASARPVRAAGIVRATVSASCCILIGFNS